MLKLSAFGSIISFSFYACCISAIMQCHVIPKANCYALIQATIYQVVYNEI